jgi:hypothetical protein
MGISAVPLIVMESFSGEHNKNAAAVLKLCNECTNIDEGTLIYHAGLNCL